MFATKNLIITALLVTSVNCFDAIPEPDCYASKVEKGVSCQDPNLCVKLPEAEGNEVCFNDGVNASDYGYSRAVYAAEDIQCQSAAYADEFCVGDPTEGVEMDGHLTAAQQEIINQNSMPNASPMFRSLASAAQYTNPWHLRDGFFEVPYKISKPSSWSNAQMDSLLWVFRWYEVNTKLRFVERTSQRDYISFNESTSGCWSYLGRIGGNQPLNLSQSCKQRGVMAHELLHALGSGHEHQRPDRDDYIDVYLENVYPGMEGQFAVKAGARFNAPYDYLSVMQYSSKIFTKDSSKPTMLPKDRTMRHLIDAQVITPSPCDFYSINKYYGDYNTAAGGCTPNVYIEVCEPTDECHRSNCSEFCRDWCEYGVSNGQCSLKWDIDTLTDMAGRHSGIDNPFQYPTYEPHPGSSSGGDMSSTATASPVTEPSTPKLRATTLPTTRATTLPTTRATTLPTTTNTGPPPPKYVKYPLDSYNKCLYRVSGYENYTFRATVYASSGKRMYQGYNAACEPVQRFLIYLGNVWNIVGDCTIAVVEGDWSGCHTTEKIVWYYDDIKGKSTLQGYTGHGCGA